MEFCLYPTISYSVYLELEAQAGTVYNHLQSKVEVIKLYTPRRCQPSEQAPRDCIQVGRECTDVHQLPCVCCRWLFRVAGDQVISDCQ